MSSACALTGRTWREAFYLVETHHTGDLEDGTAVTHDALRAFRNRPEYRFEGRIHEQIAQHLPGYLPERLERTAVRVEHFGYLGAGPRREGQGQPQPRAPPAPGGRGPRHAVPAPELTARALARRPPARPGIAIVGAAG
jgi:hypothetical protein